MARVGLEQFQVVLDSRPKADFVVEDEFIKALQKLIELDLAVRPFHAVGVHVLPHFPQVSGHVRFICQVQARSDKLEHVLQVL